MRNRLLRFVVFALALMQTFIVDAQRPFATLEHEGTMTAYYGTSAFSAAMTDAEHGDIITLSAGEFVTQYGDSITKAVTVRGAGMFEDTLNSIGRTIIRGGYGVSTIRIKVPNVSERLIMEGLCINVYMEIETLHNPEFRKCYIETIRPYYYNGVTSMSGAIFLHCICNYYGQSYDASQTITRWAFENSQFINSVMNYYGSMYPCNNYSNEILVNSIASIPKREINDMSVKNSIVFGDAYNYSTGSAGASSSYTIGINTHNYGGDYFDTATYQTRHLYDYSMLDQVFQSFDGEYGQWYTPHGVDFHLLPSIVATISGDDGTEVGIYGGTNPFDPRVVRHTVTVPSTPNEQGILNIQINTISE